MTNNNPENIPAISELAIYCNGNNELFSTLSKLLLDTLTEESTPGLRSLKPQKEIEKLVMDLHLAGGSIKSTSREELFQEMLAKSEDIWLIDRLLGRAGGNPPRKSRKLPNKSKLI